MHYNKQQHVWKIMAVDISYSMFCWIIPWTEDNTFQLIKTIRLDILYNQEIQTKSIKGKNTGNLNLPLPKYLFSRNKTKQKNNVNGTSD